MVLGRVAERAAIDDLLGGTRDHRSGSLVLTGEPGIGKSTLLAYAIDRARAQGLVVLTARGYESESEIPFAGLADLLRPVLSRMPHLPVPQREALESALSLGPPMAGDRFSVCAATIGILAAAAEDSPLLVVVDDAHWLDTSSREAVLFAARRLHAEGIALLLTSRVVPRLDTEYAGLRQLPLEAMNRADADLLFDRLTPTAPPRLRQEIYEDAAGNPLGIEELCGQLARRPALHRTPGMPPDSRLAKALGGRMADLPEATRTALLLVAASGAADTDVVLAAAKRAGLGLADFAPAEAAGLLSIEERRIEFRHPLLRSVLYGSASMHARAAAHAALAAVLRQEAGDAAADALAWHLAIARIPPDDETARLLAATGLRARRRGGYVEAARALEQSARFGTVEDRAVRLLKAARSLQLAGRSRRVLVLLEEALPLATDPGTRALILHMDSYVRMWREEPAEVLLRMLGAAAEVEAGDPGRAGFIYADAAIACFMLGRIAEALRLITHAYEITHVEPTHVEPIQAEPIQAEPSHRPGRSAGDEVIRLVTAVAMSAVLAMRSRRAEALAHLSAVHEALSAADPLARAQEYAHAAQALIWLEDYPEAERLLDRVIERARAAGAVGVLPQALGIASELYFRLGRWSEAVAAADESVTLAGESRQATLYCQYFAARLDGVLGRTEECRDRIARIEAVSRRFGIGCMDPYTGAVSGLMALAAGDVDDAIRHLEVVRGLPMAVEVFDQAWVPWAYDLVEAYARAGRAGDAEELLASVAPATDDVTHRIQHALAARCRGLLAPRETMTADFETALTWHDRADMPFERARTLLCLGERLRRDRQRSAARRYLRRALETFEHLGATVWAGRARAELTATGETLTRGPGVASRLTPQELQVAMVVARGATNAEAAAALFLSPKTIEYHLSNIYRKTQLRSRAELAVLASAAS